MVRQQAAKLDVLHNTVEDLKNELAGFKQIMAGVTRQFNENFRRSSAAVRQVNEGWISHEAAIERINERCTCGTYGSSDSDADVFETVSSPSVNGTPVLPEPVPLQVMPAFHVGQVTWRDLCSLLTWPLLAASSSGRGPFAVKSRGFCSTWPAEGCAF